MVPARERGASPTVQAGASEARLSLRVGAGRAQGPETGGAPWPPPSQHRGGIGGCQARRTADSLASEPSVTCGNSKNVKPEEKGGPGWGAPCFPWGSRGPRAPASGEDSDPQSGGEGGRWPVGVPPAHQARLWARPQALRSRRWGLAGPALTAVLTRRWAALCRDPRGQACCLLRSPRGSEEPPRPSEASRPPVAHSLPLQARAASGPLHSSGRSFVSDSLRPCGL